LGIRVADSRRGHNNIVYFVVSGWFARSGEAGPEIIPVRMHQLEASLPIVIIGSDSLDQGCPVQPGTSLPQESRLPDPAVPSRCKPAKQSFPELIPWREYFSMMHCFPLPAQSLPESLLLLLFFFSWPCCVCSSPKRPGSPPGYKKNQLSVYITCSTSEALDQFPQKSIFQSEVLDFGGCEDSFF
jgi:hypothetical protein